MTTTTAIQDGALVNYHGSRARVHGEWRFAGLCTCKRCASRSLAGEPARYVLADLWPGNRMTCVRRHSFTLRDYEPAPASAVNPETADAVWELGNGGGSRIDGSVVRWWTLKGDARAAARSIGWPMKSVWAVHTRFQHGYALKQTHGGFLTRNAFAALHDSALAARTPCKPGEN